MYLKNSYYDSYIFKYLEHKFHDRNENNSTNTFTQNATSLTPKGTVISMQMIKLNMKYWKITLTVSHDYNFLQIQLTLCPLHLKH